MSRWLRRMARRLHGIATGRDFALAVQRNRAAADRLDAVVKEMLAR